MPCLIITVGLLIPRVLGLALLLGGWFSSVSSTILWPILGIVFMPTATIWYGFVYHYLNGEWGVLAIGGMVVAILIDLGPAAGRRKTRIAK